MDLLPVGPKARHAKAIVSPRVETRVSVVGYEHVFRGAVACKHVAATHDALGGAFDEDPFLLFEPRGRPGRPPADSA